MPLQIIVTVPRGQNIGRAIIKHFTDIKHWKYVDVLSTNITRDTINRVNVAIVGFTFK